MMLLSRNTWRCMIYIAVFISMSLCDVVAKPRIVTTIKPLAIIAASAVGDAASVEYLQSPGQTGHDLHLVPSMLTQLESADLLLRVDQHFEHRFAGYFETVPSERVLTASQLGLHWPEPATAEKDEHGLERDLHFWLNPANAEVLAAAIQTHLGLPLTRLIEPAQMRYYRAALAPFKNAHYLTHHDAYGHFRTAFDLSAAPSFRDAGGGQRGISSHYDLRESALRSPPSCLFVEPQLLTKAARQFAKSHNLAVIPLDPLGTDVTLGIAAYSKFIDGLVGQFKQCFLPTP